MSALLEILDPAQNEAFSDRYINYPVDLSKCFFVTTANTLGTLTAALLDRLEIIRFTSYSDEEKIVIAKSYVLPRVIAETGMKEDQLQIFNDMNFPQIFNHTSKPLPACIVYICKNQIIAKNGDKKENRKY